MCELRMIVARGILLWAQNMHSPLTRGFQGFNRGVREGIYPSRFVEILIHDTESIRLVIELASSIFHIVQDWNMLARPR